MNAVELIEKKKLGGEYSREEIKFIIESLMRDEIPDYQLSAMLMAIYFRGMSLDETTYLTEFIVKSGQVLDLSNISDNIVDKHSTGGVGDKITLILLPLLAAADVCMAKLSGRGLGHTGGTIDKLESIPNFNTNLDIEEFSKLVKESGMAIAAQTMTLAPADGRLYALRDVTSTVDIIPLIASSVMSKKIASGADHIILDVKYGEGAFVKTALEAEKLAQIMVEVGKRLGKNVCALVTDMNNPLGRAIGNSIEIIEVIEFLKGNTCDDLAELTYEIGAIALLKTGKFTDKQKALNYLKELISSGKALDKFKQLLVNQGADADVVQNYGLLPQAKEKIEIKSDVDGFVSGISSYKIAKACKSLGAGREKKDDKIDYSVGIYLNKKHGEKVQKGDVIASIYLNNDAKNVIEQVKSAFTFDSQCPVKISLIHQVIV